MKVHSCQRSMFKCSSQEFQELITLINSLHSLILLLVLMFGLIEEMISIDHLTLPLSLKRTRIMSRKVWSIYINVAFKARKFISTFLSTHQYPLRLKQHSASQLEYI